MAYAKEHRFAASLSINGCAFVPHLVLVLALLVPGTGESSDTFFKGNCAALLPANGYPVYFVLISGLTWDDAQITYVGVLVPRYVCWTQHIRAEHATYGINSLAGSTGASIRILSHCQGRLDVPQARTFFSCVRSSIFSFFVVGPDHRGPIPGPIVTFAQQAHSGMGMAALIQQGSDSALIRELAAHGGLGGSVPTTTTLGRTRTTSCSPNFGSEASSVLAGNAINSVVQGIYPGRLHNHFTLVTDVLSWYLALQAFGPPNGLASPDSISLVDRLELCSHIQPQFQSIAASLAFSLERIGGVVDSARHGHG
jgi:hypothetical protein